MLSVLVMRFSSTMIVEAMENREMQEALERDEASGQGSLVDRICLSTPGGGHTQVQGRKRSILPVPSS